MSNIIPYNIDFYPILASWSKECGEPYPPAEYIPESTFLLEKNNKLVFTGSLILTNTPICYFEYFAGDPGYRESDRHQLSQKLFDHLVDVAKSEGYKKLCFCSYKDKLKKRYVELGANRVLDNISSFVKDLE